MMHHVALGIPYRKRPNRHCYSCPCGKVKPVFITGHKDCQEYQESSYKDWKSRGIVTTEWKFVDDFELWYLRVFCDLIDWERPG